MRKVPGEQGDDAGDECAVDGGRWARELLATRANSIMGGTSEIQRNVIGSWLMKEGARLSG